MRDGGARAEKRRAQIDVEDGGPDALVGFFEGDRRVDGGHVDEHVEASERRRGAVHQGAAAVRVRQVRGDDLGAAAERRHVRRGRFRLGARAIVGKRDVHAAPRQLAGDLRADPLRARDERGAAHQIHPLRHRFCR